MCLGCCFSHPHHLSGNMSVPSNRGTRLVKLERHVVMVGWSSPLWEHGYCKGAVLFWELSNAVRLPSVGINVKPHTCPFLSTPTNWVFCLMTMFLDIKSHFRPLLPPPTTTTDLCCCVTGLSKTLSNSEVYCAGCDGYWDAAAYPEAELSSLPLPTAWWVRPATSQKELYCPFRS